MEIQVLILFVCVVAAVWITVNLLKRDAETSEKIFWANVKRPLIYKQPDASGQSQLETIAAYERAVKSLKEHGNKWLTSSDVFLWIWGADGENTETDFERWQNLNMRREQDLIEAFYAAKANNAMKSNATPVLGQTLAGLDFEDTNEN